MKRSRRAVHSTRRELLRLGAGMACLAGAKSAYGVSLPLLADKQAGGGEIALEAPSVVEEGSSLWVTAAVDRPMSNKVLVRTISIIADGEPEQRAADFHLSRHAGRASVSTRLDLTKSQQIKAAAKLSDGTVWWTSADVGVTPSTCEDEHKGRRPPVRFLVSAPPSASRGEIIEIKVLLPHPARTGQPHAYSGDLLQRNVIREFVCEYNGTEIFRADLFPAISANPFLAFSAIAEDSGVMTLFWRDAHGQTASKDVEIVVDQG